MKFDRESRNLEKANRNSTDQYIGMLEKEIGNLNEKLEEFQITNPNYKYIFFKPLTLLRKERFRLLNNNKDQTTEFIVKNS